MRTMFDATSANAGVLVPKNPELVAIYLTGSSDIRWTATQVAFFPRVKTFVRIDQGGPTSPQFMATVVDVEPGAWSVAQAQNTFLPNCTADRPTIYCDRSDYQHVTAKCDIWLAAPGLSEAQCAALVKADPRIVAIQNVFAGSFDSSLVFDPDWPNKPAPVKPATNFEFQLEWWKPGFGWVLEPTMHTTTAEKYRVRSNNGVRWSDWTELRP